MLYYAVIGTIKLTKYGDGVRLVVEMERGEVGYYRRVTILRSSVEEYCMKRSGFNVCGDEYCY